MFHDVIIESSRNKQLIQLMEIIRSKVIYIRNNVVPKEYVHAVPDEHERIYEAIVERDADKAEKEITDHIQNGLDNMLEKISFNNAD